MSEGKILKKLEKIDQELKKQGKTLSSHGKILSEHSQSLSDHDEQLAFIREYLGEKVLTRDEYLQGQEQVMTILKRIQEDLSFNYGWLRRHDEAIQQLQTA